MRRMLDKYIRYGFELMNEATQGEIADEIGIGLDAIEKEHFEEEYDY